MTTTKPSSPFAALAALKDTLPVGDAAPAAPSKPTSPANPFRNKIVVEKSRKGRGGKTVTLVRGIVGPDDVLDGVARELKRALGCGATVEEGAVVVQGEQQDRIVTWLASKGAAHVVRGS